MDNKILLSVRGISKQFPGVLALDNIRFSLKRSSVHAIIGENGAGKSTFMKILLGMHKPNGGTMRLKGEEFAPSSPAEALSKGVSMIHQEISLVPSMSIAENIWIGREKQFTVNGFVSRKKLTQKTKEILENLKVRLDPWIEVGKLSIAHMQLVEIARALSYNSDIIIMDEPTSALTKSEVDTLYSIIRDLVEQGKSIIFISHKLDEIYAICDEVTVFRDGTYISTDPVGNISREELVTRMVGRELKNMFPKEEVAIGEVILEVKNLTRKSFFKNISFSVRRGEILGFSGLMGAGRTEIMQALFGIEAYDSGSVFLNGEEKVIKNTRKAIHNRMAMVTEDRLRKGVIHKLSVKYNITLAYLPEITKNTDLYKRIKSE